MVMALDELADILPDERYAPSRNDEEIGKSISIFLNKQKVTHMLAHTRAQLKEYLIKEEIYL